MAFGAQDFFQELGVTAYRRSLRDRAIETGQGEQPKFRSQSGDAFVLVIARAAF